MAWEETEKHREKELWLQDEGWKNIHYCPFVEPSSHTAKSESALAWLPLLASTWSLTETSFLPIHTLLDALTAEGSQLWPIIQSFLDNSSTPTGPRQAATCLNVPCAFC